MARTVPIGRWARPRTTRGEAGTEHAVSVLESIETVDPGRWNRVVERAPCGSVFHRHGWLAAIETGIGSTPRHVIVEKDGNLVGLLPGVVAPLPGTPLERVSSVYPGFGGPLATTDRRAVIEALLDAAPGLCGGRRVVHEIRAGTPAALRYARTLRAAGYRPARVCGRFVCPLGPDHEAVRVAMSRSRRRAIERASARHDHEIAVEAPTPAGIERFHDAYVAAMDRVGADPVPRAFLEALGELDDRVRLVSLRVEGTYVGGFLELLDDEQDAVHGFFAAVPRSACDGHASELLYDHVIRWAGRNGYGHYDFGGSIGAFDDGTFRFKESFGGELVPTVCWERGGGLAWPVLRRLRALYRRVRA